MRPFGHRFSTPPNGTEIALGVGCGIIIWLAGLALVASVITWVVKTVWN